LLDKTDRYRETPLHLACKKGFLRLCIYLVEDANAKLFFFLKLFFYFFFLKKSSSPFLIL